ncbi:MAG: hypothetical protein HY220_04505 [Candidatus Sungbacteria bacterium]|uniref:Uncharacterized protein n=1 Tax=Candidatus Sungiibacteriota bacterium TaxID=2750080 RepID=A0A9D6QZ28_9BACT|nr:hypothetical protein [Candidatus Sungbacteria bacterium]
MSSIWGTCQTGLAITTVLAYLSSFDYTSGSGKKTRQFNFLVETAPGDEVKLEPSEHQAYHLAALSDEAFDTLNISDATKAVLKTAAQQ